MIDGWQQVVVGATFLGLITLIIAKLKFNKRFMHNVIKGHELGAARNGRKDHDLGAARVGSEDHDLGTKDISKPINYNISETSTLTNNPARSETEVCDDAAECSAECSVESSVEASMSILRKEITTYGNSVQDDWITGIDSLPSELLLHIFGSLAKKELIKISEVNKRIHMLAFSPFLWKEIDVTLVPNSTVVYYDVKAESKPSFKVSMEKFELFKQFLLHMPCLNVVNLEFIKFDPKNPVGNDYFLDSDAENDRANDDIIDADSENENYQMNDDIIDAVNENEKDQANDDITNSDSENYQGNDYDTGDAENNEANADLDSDGENDDIMEDFLEYDMPVNAVKDAFIKDFHAKNTVLRDFNIQALSNLQCLTLTFISTSVVPIKISLPKSLKHFDLVAHDKLDNRSVSCILSAVHQCCPELEHIGVDLCRTSYNSLDQFFPGLDFIIRNVQKTIRTAVVRDSLLSKPSLLTTFMHDCEGLEALIMMVNGERPVRRLNVVTGEYERPQNIVVSNLLSETRHKNLQIFGLYGVNDLGHSHELFDRLHGHVYSNIRVLGVYNLYGDFTTFSEYFPNLLVFYIGATEGLRGFDEVEYFITKCRSLRQIAFQNTALRKPAVLKLAKLKKERPSLEIFTDYLFDYREGRATIEELMAEPPVGFRENGDFKPFEMFKFDIFFPTSDSSGCFTDRIDEMKKLLDQLQNSL